MPQRGSANRERCIESVVVSLSAPAPPAAVAAAGLAHTPAHTQPPPHGTLTTDGIDGAQPRRFISMRTLPGSGSTADIPGARPTIRNCLVRSPRSVPRNPLSPDYALPPAPEPSAEVPRFIRNTLDISDIAGARVRWSWCAQLLPSLLPHLRLMLLSKPPPPSRLLSTGQAHIFAYATTAQPGC